MLSPSDYDRLCDQIITLYDDLDNAVIEDMTRRIIRMGGITEATKWQAKQLQESGMLYDDIIAEIALRTDAAQNQVRTLFEDAGVQSIRNDNRRYRAAGLEGIVKMSDSALQTLYAGFVKCGGDLQNLTLTTANTAQTAYINACNQAYMQVTSGAFSYQQAIRQAIQKNAQTGSVVTYPSGHRDRLDVAVRRSVLTGIGQTVRQISLINANDMGCDLMEITAHAGARPSHAAWQGKIVSLSGRRGYLSLKDIGYGTGDGFGGWNCRHDWYPFFEGISEPAYTARQLAKLDEKNIEYNGKMYSQYEISQIQRRYEREIRAAKREQVAFRTAVQEADDPELRQVMQDSLNYSNSLVRDKQVKMRDFINQTGQDRDYFREQNYPKSNNSKKAVSLTFDSNNSQYYKPVELDENNPKNITRRTNFGYTAEIKAFKAKNTINNIYISDKVEIKPKFQHEVDVRLSKVYKILNAENQNNKPLACIISNQEMNTNAPATYNAVQNVLYINEKIIDIENMKEDTGFTCPDNKYSTILHECIHWSDAENYRQNHRQITNENYGTEYLPQLRTKCKKSLDKLIKKDYNISEISDYAMKEFGKGHFDETYTEYRTKKLLEGE